MNRRTFLCSSGLGIAAAFLVPNEVLATPRPAASGQLATPTAAQLAWQRLEFGMFIHLGLKTWADPTNGNIPPLSAIDPDIDTDNWARCAVNLGARYVVFVAKHATGFCWWPTRTTAYSVAHIPWDHGHGDVLKNLRASCDKFGLKLGVYLSPRDDHFGARTGGICKTPQKQKAYDALYREQLTEVLSRYGTMVEIWFDGSTVVPVGDIVARYAPDAAIFQGPEATMRWVGNENGFAPYPCWNALPAAEAATGVATAHASTPHGNTWMPVEADVSIRRPQWFWSPTNLEDLMTLDQLLEVYYRSVGRGAQLLLNVPPDRTGHMDPHDFARAKAFGDAVQRRFSHPIGATSGSGNIVTIRFSKRQRVDHVILQEDCRDGQRVLAYRVEGLTESGWQSLANGTSIGHQRIQPFVPLQVNGVRLKVTSALATPHIRRFAVYDTHAMPPSGWNVTSPVSAPTFVGHWSGRAFRLDLTAHIHRAAQYLVRFSAVQGHVTALNGVTLLFHGVAEPGMVQTIPGSPGSLLLDITGIGQTIVLKGTVESPGHGTVQLQRL